MAWLFFIYSILQVYACAHIGVLKDWFRFNYYNWSNYIVFIY